MEPILDAVGRAREPRGVAPERSPIELTDDEIALLVEALDSYEYWELGDVLPRNNGMVFIPGDCVDEPDRYWSDDHAVTAAQTEAIEQVRACRALADRLRQPATPIPEQRAT